MLSLSQFQRNFSRTKAPLILLVLSIASMFIPALAETPIRKILGMVLVLLLPGYSLALIVFQQKIRLSGIEFVASTIFLSVTIVTLIGIILNRTSYGIRLIPVLLCISAFVLSVFVITHLLKRKTLDLFESTDAHDSVHDREGAGGFLAFISKHYEVFGISLACMLIYILNTLPFFFGKTLLDIDEWMHIGQVNYVLNTGHTTNYTVDRGIMVQPIRYPPAFHTFVAILILFTNFSDIFVFKWIILAVFDPLLVLATYLMIFQFAGKKKALVTSLFMATWTCVSGATGPLWPIPTTFSLGFFMFCFYSLAKYYDTKESSFLVTGGMILCLVLLSHLISGSILFLSLSSFLILKMMIHRTVSKEDLYLLSVMVVTAVIAGILYWISARTYIEQIVFGAWGQTKLPVPAIEIWESTNWFTLSHLFLRIPFFFVPFGLFVILRTYKRVESLLLTSCFCFSFFFSFSYLIGIYIANMRFELYFNLISYALSGLGLFKVSRFISNRRSNIRIYLVALLTACYALFRIIYPFSNHPFYVAHKSTYDLYANFVLGALILTTFVFITYRTFENPDGLVAFFAILIVIGSSLITAISNYHWDPFISENEYLAVQWLKESHEPNTIVIYETLRLAWFGGASGVNTPNSRFYGETNFTQRAIDRNDILKSPDTNLTIKLLREYHITYIYTQNGSNVSQKFQSLTAQLPHYFRITYQNEGIIIYEFLSIYFS